jgi:hypothetical protein
LVAELRYDLLLALQGLSRPPNGCDGIDCWVFFFVIEELIPHSKSAHSFSLSLAMSPLGKIITPLKPDL